MRSFFKTRAKTLYRRPLQSDLPEASLVREDHV